MFYGLYYGVCFGVCILVWWGCFVVGGVKGMKHSRKMSPKSRTRFNALKSGETSKRLNEFKDRTGLVLKGEVEALPEASQELLARKLALMERYTVAQQKLVDVFGSVGGRMVSSLTQVVDLQGKLWELEDKLSRDGMNPLENVSWMRAREQLSKELQFIHKYQLDVADVQDKISTRKKARGDDVVFNVEGGEGE